MQCSLFCSCPCRYGFAAMEVQEAFTKIKEEANAYLEGSTDLMAGLNLLSTTNLDYFGVRAASALPSCVRTSTS